MSDTATVLAAMFTVIGASVGPAWVVASVIGKRIDDLAARTATLEAKIDGLTVTVTRFDERLGAVERRA